MAYINGNEVLFSPKIIKASDVNDNPLHFAKTLTFESMNVFGKAVVELNIGKVSTLDRLFYVTTSENKNTTVENLTINHNGQPISMSEMIYSTGSSSNDNALKYLTLNIDTSKCQNFKGIVQGRQGLITIDGKPLDFSSNTQSSIACFNMCYSLVDFRVAKGTIKQSFNVSATSVLSAETVESVIDGLADLTGKETQTLSLNNAVGNKLTDTQKATITAKNWTLAY